MKAVDTIRAAYSKLAAQGANLINKLKSAHKLPFRAYLKYTISISRSLLILFGPVCAPGILLIFTAFSLILVPNAVPYLLALFLLLSGILLIMAGISFVKAKLKVYQILSKFQGQVAIHGVSLHGVSAEGVSLMGKGQGVKDQGRDIQDEGMQGGDFQSGDIMQGGDITTSQEELVKKLGEKLFGNTSANLVTSIELTEEELALLEIINLKNTVIH